MDLSPFTETLLDVVVPALITVLGTLITIGMTRLNAWLRSKVHVESFRCASEKLDKLVGDAVVEAERTLVREYQAAKADGKLTVEDGEKVRDAVVDVVKRHLGKRGLAEIEGCLGIEREHVEGMIRTRIESALDRLKKNDVASPSHAPGNLGPDDETPVRPAPAIPKSIADKTPPTVGSPGPRSGR